MIIPVVLSGGSGSRLWPLSREAYPKQFLTLAGTESLLGATLTRVRGILDIALPIVVSNSDYRFIVANELQQRGILKESSILLEPVARNTAPAIALAAFWALTKSSDPTIMILPADHVIEDVSSFQKAVEIGVLAADQGELVTFGIRPDFPHTGYGYIHADQAKSSGWSKIKKFVEKPPIEKAQSYLKSGDYFWNSGMFLFKAKSFLDELAKFKPDLVELCQKALELRTEDLDFIRVSEDYFAKCEPVSVDYAVMEKTERAVMVPLDAGWSDVGSWSSLWDILDKTEDQNVIRGDVLSEDTDNSYIHSDSRLIATLGVSNLVIVETSDAVLVADKEKVEDVKKLVLNLQKNNRQEFKLHKKVYRPWGSYEVIALEERFQVKRIVVNPGQQLSIQMHHHRAEHWVVVRGTAIVGKDGEEILLGEDRSTYIPLGVKHYLKNPGLIPLELIEVQSGSYLGEDDIVRFTDIYGRV